MECIPNDIQYSAQIPWNYELLYLNNDIALNNLHFRELCACTCKEGKAIATSLLSHLAKHLRSNERCGKVMRHNESLYISILFGHKQVFLVKLFSRINLSKRKNYIYALFLKFLFLSTVLILNFRITTQ